ncbi:MAG TPA: aldolase/citrate lyase family protein, partial [Chloroflexota bacterium]|nr:aldolase/citrate lyase family protein [Chloroflexota bacterium]
EDRSFEGGVLAAKTWADYIAYEMEHGVFDIRELSEFMRGLAAGGPTRSGHATPAVIVTLPMIGDEEATVNANAWQIKQVLATGVHGILLCHAESPDAVRAFVKHCRYPFNRVGGDGLEEGRRGGGGQASAAAIWGVSVRNYLDLADPWPLNPKGELFLGLKIENKRALANVEKTAAVSGIAFAEWGPGDMGMSLGFPDNHDEPFPPEMVAARSRILAACKANNLAFLNTIRTDDVIERIAEGVRIGAGPAGEAAAEIGRKHTGRTMPW